MLVPAARFVARPARMPAGGSSPSGGAWLMQVTWSIRATDRPDFSGSG